jgi:ABC-type arginine transport system ATPase subunit
MLTKIAINNFKRLANVEIELGNAVVFVGPNNSGKTTALQALSLWDFGLRKWAEKRRDSSARERTGVTINRRDLLSIPIPGSRLLWRDLHIRNVARVEGHQKTTNITFTIAVEGVSNGSNWHFALEFDYANEESIYCRAVDWPESVEARTALLDAALARHVVFLPPMSGLAAQEFRKESGEIGVLIGQGRTAEVLRNLCHRIHTRQTDNRWSEFCTRVHALFGIDLLPPDYLSERSELTMSYREPSGIEFDLSSAGRGLQQTALLLAYLYDNPDSVLLLDEPDAHLEVLRQREIYNLINEVAAQQSSQVVVASHSEVVLNEAAERDVVVAFVGRPHRIDSRQQISQASKALSTIRFDQYYLAENRGWLLYLEGSTDLAILATLARKLGHRAADCLAQPPVDYVKNNVPSSARESFFGLREAKSDLVGIALFDRLTTNLQAGTPLRELMWRRRELENYITSRDVLLRVARAGQTDDLFGVAEATRRSETMAACIDELENALRITGKPSPWSPDIKVTDDFLDPLFKNYYNRLGIPQLIYKRDYHVLATHLERAEIDPEIAEKLDAIAETAALARPAV